MSRQGLLEHVAGSIPLIAPSMLKCDFGNLHREVDLLEAGGAKILHMDVMDGHFVPNLSYGAMVIERVRELTELPFEAHLMISEPARYLDDFLKAGCNLLTIHLEAVPEPRPLLTRIREHGALAGLAINPKTPVESLEPFLDAFDVALVMSVEPGFGGQKFMPSAPASSVGSSRGSNRGRLPRWMAASTWRPSATSQPRERTSLWRAVAIFEAGDYGHAMTELAGRAKAAAAATPR